MSGEREEGERRKRWRKGRRKEKKTNKKNDLKWVYQLSRADLKEDTNAQKKVIGLKNKTGSFKTMEHCL